QNTYLSTHNAFANPDEGFKDQLSNQAVSIVDQLNAGVRSVNLDIWVVRQKKVAGTWQMRIYKDDESVDTLLGVAWGSAPLEVVVAHDPFMSGHLLLKPGNKFKALST